MVATVTSYTDARYRASAGLGYDGVVRISNGTGYGTGALLFDGRAVLTAAHLVAAGAGSLSVAFQTQLGSEAVSVVKSVVHPDYIPGGTNNDLAIVWLSRAPSLTANRYELYRDNNEIGQSFTMVGFGQLGDGATGATITNTNALRVKAQNTFDADAASLKAGLGSSMGWSPLYGTQLVADFDNGSTSQDALGRLLNLKNLGLGLDEGLIAHGDSGGPAFLAGKVAGVGSYTASLSYGAINPDVDSTTNSSFGEVAAWQRVSGFQQWIDQSMLASYPNPPTKAADVKKEVVEGNLGTTYAYFLVQLVGVRAIASQVLSVEYATRDGTAKAGSDYLAVSGRLNLYPGETQAVIPVEIVCDTTPEPSETFYLDVFNPVGGSFSPNVVKLTAVRTILDDDLPIV
jgi:Calx-beta domain/Trypsin